MASLVTVATEPEQGVGPFAAQAAEREVERVVVGCCSPESLFREALGGREQTSTGTVNRILP